MTDWFKTSGVDGTMRIRDTGSTVEFAFKAGHPTDWINGLEFSWSANGNTYHRTINYPTGAPWYEIGSVSVSSSQTVTFKMVTDTSIAGIGGPTTFSHSISRDTIPKAPSIPSISAIKSTSVYVTFKDGANGGDAIDARQIGYGTSSTSKTTIIGSDGATTVSGLNAGTTYYFWARTHNSVGWSPWSSRASARTIAGPAKMGAPLLSSVTSTSVDVAFTPNDDGGSKITAYQIGYGTSSSTPTTTVSASSPQVVKGLTPGTVYYFFVRAQNSVGWSPWSAPRSARTVAGAYIKVGAVWKLAVPYVNVGGVWKRAEPWSRSAGVWRRTI